MKTALITGVTGQDGSYLAEFLLEKGYDVHGIIRRSSVDFRERIAHLEGQPHFHLHYGDMGDSMGLVQVVDKVQPDEIYNLAAQSHVQVSFDSPEFTADVDATGVLRILEAVRACHLEKTCRIYQSSMVKLRKFHRTRILLSIPIAHTLLQSSMASGLSRSIVRHTTCTVAQVYSSTMSQSAVVRPS